ncbi:MAG: acyltransferase [Chitinophagales bacterium]|nr:acyltransferase [Chitinophagales bacterium]
MPLTDSVKPYWANLDALRFIAFMGVFMAHVYSLSISEMRVPAWMAGIKEWSQAGGLGLNFLFVLSGFLITYLLLLEEKVKGIFHIRNYFIRRTLRIWPLYFLVVAASFLLLPPVLNALGKSYAETANPWYYILFISNFYILSYGYPYSPLLAILWSLAVEEQFYLIWPWLMKGFKNFRRALFVLLLIISVLFRWIHEGDSKILFFHTLSLLGDFAVGGLLAEMVILKNKFFVKLTAISTLKILTGYIIIALMIIFYRQIFHFGLAIIFERLLFALAFSFIIFEQTFCVNRIFNAASIPFIAWLGSISYGLYCFHELAILLAKNLLAHLHLLYKPTGHFLFLPAFAFVILLPLAIISYYVYENRFLNLKKRFEL